MSKCVLYEKNELLRAKHRLPESCDYVNQPTEATPYTNPSILPEDQIPRIGLCPKCHSTQSDMITYDSESATFKCRRCGFRYAQLKASPYEYVAPKIELSEMPKSLKPKSRRHFPIGKVIGLSLLIVLVGVFLWNAPTIISTVQNLFSQSSYTKLTLVVGQYTVYDHGDNHYVFAWRLLLADSPNLFVVSTGFQTQTFSTTQGATYTSLGLEIKVSEVHTDYIVLLVKPTY